MLEGARLASASRRRARRGTIARKLADVAVLSQDICNLPAAALPGTTSVLTIVGGRIVHEQAPPP